jgi:hypothetical protein
LEKIAHGFRYEIAAGVEFFLIISETVGNLYMRAQLSEHKMANANTVKILTDLLLQETS